MSLNYVIYGAGGIGGVIGARLHQAGLAVTLIARGAHADVMQRQGLTLIDPHERKTLEIPTVTSPAAAVLNVQTVVLMCMKSQHTEAALRDLAATSAGSIRLACVQNGVANERMALRYFPRVFGTVVNLPAMFLNPGEVVTHADGQGGILDTGCYPRGVDEVSEVIVTDFKHAGFSANATPTVMRQKYAKLLLNLVNVMQAGIRDMDNAAELVRDARREALSCFAAAGIDCATKEETERRRRGVYRMADIEGYPRTAGSSWQSMARGTGDIETEYLNGEICLLGRLHGVATPVNDACVRMARALLQRGAGPHQFTAAQVTADVEQNASEPSEAH